MKIEYIKSGRVNYHKWDACIDASINRMIYAYSWYLDLLAEDWDALVAEDYTFVFPLPFRIKRGVKYVYMPLFTQQLGVFSQQPVTGEVMNTFLQAIPKEVKWVDLNLNKFNPLTAEWSASENVNVELDLIPSYEKLQQSYSTNLKRNIKKAVKKKLILDKSIAPESMVSLFADNRGAELGVFSETDYKKLVRLSYMLIYKGLAQVWGVYGASNQLLAAALWVRSHQRYILLFTGLTQEGKDSAAMHFLIDSFVKASAGSPAILDFEGSNNPGLQKFYMSFGAQKHHYKSIQLNRFSALTKIFVSAYKKFRQ